MPRVKETRIALRVHSLTPDIALLVWEDGTAGGRGGRLRATVDGRPARPPYSHISVALGTMERNIMVLRLDAAAVRHERICIAQADGTDLAVADAVDPPAERLVAFAPADLVSGVAALGRVRIARLILEIVPGIFRLGDSRVFAAACRRLADVLAPTPPALLPCSRLFGSYRLFAGTADAALGGTLTAVVISGGEVRSAPFTPAFATNAHEGGPGCLLLALRDSAEDRPGAIVVVFNEGGMICQRIAFSDRPVPTAAEWFRCSGSAKIAFQVRRYVLDCLAHLGRQDGQAAAFLGELQAMVPGSGGGRGPAPIVAAAGSCEVIEIGCVSRQPYAAVIGPVPEDPLLMRCRAGLFATDPAMRAVEMVYVLDGTQNQREIAHFLHDLHAAYGIAARLVVVPHAGTAAAALNTGVQVSRAPVLVSLGHAVLPEHPTWLSALTRHLRHHADVGIVAATLLHEDRTLWNDGLDIGLGTDGRGSDVWDIRPVRAGLPGGLAGLSTVRQVAGVSPGCVAVRRSVLERCGGFSQRYLSSDYSVADLCLAAAAAGLKTCLTSEATLFRLDPTEDECRRREALDPRAEIDRRLLERCWRARLEASADAQSGRAA